MHGTGEALDVRGVVEGHAVRDAGSAIVSDHGEPPMAERFHHEGPPNLA